MGKLSPVTPVKLFIGVLTSSSDLLPDIRQELQISFGSIEAQSTVWDFTYTDYYADEMGTNLQRTFFSFSDLFAPYELAQIKRQTNELEQFLADRHATQTTQRPVNLDPGYLEASKLVLASTKNFSHRICIGDGIYAELTLQYRKGVFTPLPWSYPDYQSEQYQDFFSQVRVRYLEQLRGD
ncbi:MAG TPA: DUF4416 family protein [bacterium]|nr:DUF4416 family protein [bacterium]